MPLDQDFVQILRCPIDRTPVRLLSEEEIRVVNNRIVKGGIRYNDGEKVPPPVEQALITEDGKTIYIVDSDIPVMLRDKAIDAGQFGENAFTH